MRHVPHMYLAMYIIIYCLRRMASYQDDSRDIIVKNKCIILCRGLWINFRPKTYRVKDGLNEIAQRNILQYTFFDILYTGGS